MRLGDRRQGGRLSLQTLIAAAPPTRRRLLRSKADFFINLLSDERRCERRLLLAAANSPAVTNDTARLGLHMPSLGRRTPLLHGSSGSPDRNMSVPSSRQPVSSSVFDGLKIFSATMTRDRAQLGERISTWLEDHPDYEIVDTVVTQSSDRQYHCIAITLFWRTKGPGNRGG
jgi:hypothetical protein